MKSTFGAVSWRRGNKELTVLIGRSLVRYYNLPVMIMLEHDYEHKYD